MPLVDYSDSDDSDKATLIESQGTKRKRPSPTSTLPPLPDSFHNLYASTTRLSSHDDPSLHGGRQRQIPHVEGNWPTHVYIECSCKGGFPSTEDSGRLQDILTRLADTDVTGGDRGVHTLLRSDLGTELPLHISLSRPIVLKEDQRQGFLERLTERIENASVMPFSICTSKLEWHPNLDRSRYFLVLRLDRDAEDQMLKLLKASNAAAWEIGQSPLYAAADAEMGTDCKRINQNSGVKRVRFRGWDMQDGLAATAAVEKEEEMAGAFHVSIGWVLKAPEEAAVANLKDASVVRDNFSIRVENVKVKMGNGISVIPLSEKMKSSNGIFES